MSEPQRQALGMAGVFGMGGLLLAITLFVDPIGSSPHGAIDLGPKGTRWLLGGMGLAFIVGGALLLARRGRAKR